MTAWDRLRSLADRVLAGDDGRQRADDAIYLSENAYRERLAGAPAAPKIHERHFGLGLRRERPEAASQAPRPGLLARLGLRRLAADDAAYVGTKIVGTPAKPQAAPEPPRLAEVEPKRPAVKKSAPPPAAPEPRAAEIDEPRKPAPTPVPAAPEPRSATIDKPKPAPAQAKAPTPRRAPAVRPAAEKPGDDEAMLRRLFGEPEPAAKPKPAPAPAPAKTAPKKPAPAKAVKKKKKMDRGDVTIATLGVLLAVTCAAFPWYIFFNQEQFGVREFVFSGGGSARPSPGAAFVPQPVGKPFASAEVPKLELDFFPTATLPADREPARAVPASEQPFPSDRVNFRLVHVANGRAMIEDADGLWVVQRGSRLPDASRVVAIEQRGASWVLVTSNDGIVKLQPD